MKIADRFGQLVRKVQTTNGHAFTLGYGYSAGGRLQTVTYPDGAKVDYLRNALGQISQVGLTRTGGSRQIIATGITYAPFGSVTGWTDGGGRVLTRAYNLNYQPQSVRDAGAGGLDLAFEYDPAGNLSLLKNGAGAAVAQYGYDALNRLTQTKDGPTGTPIETYGYDKTGNRASLVKAGVTTAYTYPAASHRLSNVGGVNRGYSAAGNLTSIGSTQRQFTYNNANRLSTAKANGVTTGSYRYNGKGELVRQYLSTTNTYTVFDEAGHWLGDYSTPSTPRQQAIWLDDLPIGVLTGAGAGQTVQYLQPDHLGSPRVAIDAIRNKAVWTWDLKGEAFGSTPPHQDPDGDGQAFVLNLRYPGQRFDAATGLNYNYFRDYEPGTGRYVQSDPKGLYGDIATYSYASNRPLIYFDPDGQEPIATGCSGANGITLCDGKGGFETRVCRKGCMAQCTQVHEETHRQFFLSRAPNRCFGKKRGDTPSIEADVQSPFFWYQSECAAHRAGKKCAEKFKENNKDKCVGAECERDIKDYLEAQNYFIGRWKCDAYGW